MADKLESLRDRNPRKMAEPEALLLAAKAAPKLFDIGGYFEALQVMREKGYSWRHLGEWVRGFNIEISHVHLRRLYVQESERQARTAAQNTGEAGESGPERWSSRGRTKATPAADIIPAHLQQEDLLRYEGMARDATGPDFNVRND